jgi:5-hydroxyisourate hydrolase
MTIITSHILNGTDGTHAMKIPAKLMELKSRKLLVHGETDDGGRLSLQIKSADIYPSMSCELVISLTKYWELKEITGGISEIALRFSVYQSERSYHLPVIINPHSYSTWISS